MFHLQYFSLHFLFILSVLAIIFKHLLSIQSVLWHFVHRKASQRSKNRPPAISISSFIVSNDFEHFDQFIYLIKLISLKKHLSCPHNVIYWVSSKYATSKDLWDFTNFQVFDGLNRIWSRTRWSLKTPNSLNFTFKMINFSKLNLTLLTYCCIHGN